MSGVWARVATWPLWQCGFRPFYLGSAASAVLLLPTWLALLTGALSLPVEDAVYWHAGELLHGFAYAALAGFLLTAVPEFTGSPGAAGARLIGLVLLWLFARFAGLLAAWLTAWPAALLDIAFLLWLAGLVAPPIWREPSRAHRSLLYALITLILARAGGLAAADASAWLRVEAGVFMAYIVLALSRISMRLVNGILQAQQRQDLTYRAAPPRRNLAVFAIAAHTLAQWALPGASATGWLALAAAAAVFNLLNDWHLGRILFNRWVFLLYLIYWLMGLGYLLLGLTDLGAPLPASAGWHLLLAGAMSLAIYAVMLISGRIHAGYRLAAGPWPLLGAALLFAAAWLRVLAAWPALAPWSAQWLPLSGLAWAAAFALLLWQLAPALTGPRPDAGLGCDGRVPTHDEDHAFAC